MLDPSRNIRLLARAEYLLWQVRLRAQTTKIVIVVVAGLFGFAALTMINVAAFLSLSEAFGLVWGAVITALVQAALAALLVVVAGRVKPGPEAAMAKELRNAASAQLDDDLAFVGRQIGEVGAGLRTFDLGRLLPAAGTLSALLATNGRR